MKTNFENAVKLLMEGRCEAIAPEGTCTKYVLRGNILNHDFSCGITPAASTFLGQWECIGYKPEMEKVEVKRWACLNPDGSISSLWENYPTEYTEPTFSVIELSGSYQRPVAEKAKHRVEMNDVKWKLYNGSNVIYPWGGGGNFASLLEKVGTLVFEWEE